MEEAVQVIIGSSVRLRCTVETRTRALLIYHQFKRCVHDVEYDCQLVAAACLGLGIKYNESPLKFQSLILVFFSMEKGSDPRGLEDKEFKRMCKSVFKMQCLILRMIEFSLNHVLPFDYLKCIIANFREPLIACNYWDSFNETCMKIICDLYVTNKCLVYKSEEIAISAVHAALNILGTNLNAECYLVPWLKLIDVFPLSELISDMYNTFAIPDINEKRLVYTRY